MARAPRTIDQLPLFSDDESIGEVVLGRERAGEFKGFATLLENQGMPKISPVWGGRYVPAVKAFFDAEYGLATAVPLAPDGVEGSFHGKQRKAAEKPRPQMAASAIRTSGPVLVR